jgi:indoleamine 2,3-dioxygenase
MENSLQIDLSNGFLPSGDPLMRLPSAYDLWEKVCAELPKLLACGQLRTTIDHLPLLATDQLTTTQELDRAMLLLSFLGHAYVWGGSTPPQKIPRGLVIPWCEVAMQLGRPPILSYASYALNNWRRLHKSEPIALGNIVLMQNFLGGIDEEWFVLVHVDIEMKAAPALQVLNKMQHAAVKGDNSTLQQNLVIVAQSLQIMCETLDRMPEHCDPYIYYNRVRPYIHGWEDNPVLPHGLIYEGVTAFAGKPQSFRGETGAQSSIIPALDAALGIEHRDDPLRIYLQEMRDYMPLAHRRFILDLEKGKSVREYILKSYSAMPSLRTAYNDCIRLISRFRKTHLHYAALYIQKQSQTSMANPTATGTGGTPLMMYLRKHKDETLGHLIPD